MSTPTFTHSALAAFRDCPRKYALRYEAMLELDRDDEAEALAVGSAWHSGMEVGDLAERCALLRRIAPSELWGVKLSALAAGHAWYWKGEGLTVESTEREFAHPFRVATRSSTGKELESTDAMFIGKIDGDVRAGDGRLGIIEYKTTSESLDGKLLDKLRLDLQVSTYALLATRPDVSFPRGRPDFILYDVVRKPTIAPKSISKKDVARMRRELDESERCTYYGEAFGEVSPGGISDVLMALDEGRECPRLYGARLLADIGDRPEHYFARREVHRTDDDYSAAVRDLGGWLANVLEARENRVYPRNPDACQRFGTCEFFGLCSNNTEPSMDGPRGGSTPPDGYRRRKRRHSELTGDFETAS